MQYSTPTQFALEDGFALRMSARNWEDFWSFGLSSRGMLGDQPSSLKGQGMDFEELRPYQLGDEYRHIDWSAMARTGRLFTKVFQQEMNQPCWLVLSCLRSMYFASRGVFKSVLASQLLASLAWSASAANVSVGGSIMHPLHDKLLDSSKGEAGPLTWLRELEQLQTPHQTYFSPEQMLNNLSRLSQVADRHDRMIMITDAYDWDDHLCDKLGFLAEQHQMLCFFIYDPLEHRPPPAGSYRYRGYQGDPQTMEVRAGSDALAHLKHWQRRLHYLKKMMEHGIGIWPLTCAEPLLDQLQSPNQHFWELA